MSGCCVVGGHDGALSVLSEEEEYAFANLWLGSKVVCCKAIQQVTSHSRYKCSIVH